MVVQKLAGGDFSFKVSRFISATNLIALYKGGTKFRSITISVVMRRMITKAFMPASFAEAKAHLAPLQVSFCGVKSGLDGIFQDNCDAFIQLGWDAKNIGVSVDAPNAFKMPIRDEMLRQKATPSLSLIRFANVLYANGQLYLRFGNEWLLRYEVTQQGDPVSFFMLVHVIHSIVQRIEAECDFVVHR